MVGIILNPSAAQAANNLGRANSQVEGSIARLSSGNRIINAKDDVAGLAVGTILQTNVSTMKAALTNAAQATSLLILADGALNNISQILQRQKALASEATSGSLNDQARGFLNSEFQNLVEEINRTANSTNFNGINLIDGSLFTSSNVHTDTKTLSTSLSATISFGSALATGTDYIQFFSAANKAPAGMSRTFNTDAFQAIKFTSTATAAQASYPLNLLQFDGTATAASAATNFLAMIENLRKYTGDNQQVLIARNTVSAFDFNLSGTNLKVTSKGAGSNWNSADVVVYTTAAAALTVNSTASAAGAATTVALTAGGTAAADGALPAGGFSSSGTFSAGATAYSNDSNRPGLVPSTYAQGNVTDSILAPLTQTQAWSTGVNLSNVSNNPGFVGEMPSFTGDYIDHNTVNLKVEVGGILYQANNINTLPTGATNDEVTFYSQQAGYGSFTLQFKSGGGLTVGDQTTADTYVSRLNSSFSGIDIFQRRSVDSYVAAGTVYPTGGTVASGDLAGSNFWLISDDFSNVEIQDVTVAAPPSSSSAAVISITINGEVYTSGYNYDGSSYPLTSLNNQLTNTGGVNSDGKYGFVNQSNPNKMLVMQYASSTTPLSITSADQASGLESALKVAFGIGSGKNNTGLSFQVGTSSSDVIQVQISGTRTEQIYQDDNGNPQELNIATLQGANFAGDVLDSAIQTVTSIRAQVGSLQSRFEFASASIQSSIDNQDAARSVFLDADISQESTNLAQAQVRLQASISTLAQANQLPQQLLKLIG